MNFRIEYKYFDQLSLTELYHIWDIRDEVFLEEQKCTEKETDFKDLQCYHLMIWDKDILVAYARLLAPGISYPEASIGRIACRMTYRGKKIGKLLLEKSLEFSEELFGNVAIKISAQAHLEKFYSSFGFEKVSDIYLESGIEHIKMLRQPH